MTSQKKEESIDKLDVVIGTSEEFMVTNKEKSKVLEHYKLWVMTRLYYQELDNTMDDRKYVNYDVLLRTPCSSMWEYPLQIDDLQNALFELVKNKLVEIKFVTNEDKLLDYEFAGSDEFNKNVLDKNTTFKLSITGNLILLQDLNKVLKFDSYQIARDNMDDKITVTIFLKKTLKELNVSGDIEDVKKNSIKYFLTSFNVFLALKEFFTS